MEAEIKLPVNYERLTQAQRRKIRQMYINLQGNSCYHCSGPLDESPEHTYQIDWSLFPGGKEGFLRYPVHLHHSHESGDTIGAVHSYCNAVLWQYYGE